MGSLSDFHLLTWLGRFPSHAQAPLCQHLQSWSHEHSASVRLHKLKKAGKMSFLGNRVMYCNNTWPFIVSGTWEQYERVMVPVFQFLSPSFCFSVEKRMDGLVNSPLFWGPSCVVNYMHTLNIDAVQPLKQCSPLYCTAMLSSCGSLPSARGGKPQRRVKPSLIKWDLWLWGTAHRPGEVQSWDLGSFWKLLLYFGALLMLAC